MLLIAQNNANLQHDDPAVIHKYLKYGSLHCINFATTP